MENSQIEGEDTRIQETEKEVIICDDESLMKYLVGKFLGKYFFFIIFLILFLRVKINILFYYKFILYRGD